MKQPDIPDSVVKLIAFLFLAANAVVIAASIILCIFLAPYWLVMHLLEGKSYGPGLGYLALVFFWVPVTFLFFSIRAERRKAARKRSRTTTTKTIIKRAKNDLDY
jgi:uncharacterized membrane protein